MGKARRPKPARLAGKLLEIRQQLELSQNGLIRHLGFSGELFQSGISAFELGTREPPLPVLLEYARVANIYVDVLINDDLDLPAKLPSSKKSDGVKRASAARRRKR
jgi:transcriptional regulator with XRE-family HTH domain